MPRSAWRAASSFSVWARRGALRQGGLEAPDALGRLAHDRVVMLEHHPVGGMLEGEPGQPGVMGTAPGSHPDRRLDGAAQQELAESVLGAQQVRLGIVASPDQVAHLGDGDHAPELLELHGP